MSSESEFWCHLQMRINTLDPSATLGYCDWIEPERYLLGESDAHVIGRAGFLAKETRQHRFRLALPDGSTDLTRIQWSNLLPAPGATGWLTVSDDLLVIDTTRGGQPRGAA